jgi:phytoene synthase
MENYGHAAGQLRQLDRDRYICDLFAPESARNHLFALHAFDAEIARIRFVVSEPGLGEIRLQWWRDALANRQGGGNPLAEALLLSIAAGDWPVPAFLALLDARIFDLYNDPMPSMADFEGYAGETSSVLFQFAAMALGVAGNAALADAAGHAGVASVLTGALRRFGADASRHRLFLPRDRFEQHGVNIDDIFAARPSLVLSAALADLRALARVHLVKAKAAATTVAPAAVPAFLPLALIEADLAQIEKSRDPFALPPEMPRWQRQWLIWRAARRGLL